MSSLRLVSMILCVAACGSSRGARGNEAAPSAREAGAASSTSDAPSTASEEIRAVPLTAARMNEGAYAAAGGAPPNRTDACMDLGVFEEGWEDACKPGMFDGSKASGLRAPWTSADVVRLNAGGDQDSTACALIVAVGDAAYVARDWLAFCDDDDKALASARWALADVVAGGAPELVLELTREEQEILDGERTPSGATTYRAWCGIGPSGKAACTPPVEQGKASGLRPVFP